VFACFLLLSRRKVDCQEASSPKMDEKLDDTNFDAILLGTSLPNTILARSRPSLSAWLVPDALLIRCRILRWTSALARAGKKVLHLDRNEFYGAGWASFSLKDFQAWAEQRESPPRSNPLCAPALT